MSNPSSSDDPVPTSPPVSVSSTSDEPQVRDQPTDVAAWWQGALAGLVAGAVAIGVGELVTGLLAPTPGLVAAVANRVIDLAPASVNEVGKDLFGLKQKTALTTGTTILALVFASVLGVASLKRPWIGASGITAFGIVGMFAIADDAQGSPVAGAVIAGLATIAGVAALYTLVGVANDQARGPSSQTLASDQTTIAAAAHRRTFMGWVLLGGGLAMLGNFAGQALRNRSSAEGAREDVALVGTDDSSDVATQIADAQNTEVAATAGITPIVVPNDNFYRIDTAIIVPQINPDDWELSIKGMVDNPRTYSFMDLVERATTVAPVTLSCVSNEVGGNLVGNAVWQGVPLTELLDEAGVQSGATQIKSQSVDGWNCGFPTDLAYDGRTALVAVAMNGEALPIEHGFPVRLVVSGLYGYVSATKWLSEIELTRLEDFDGYWIPRGWSKDGPVKTQSRIDTPHSGSGTTPGQQLAVAGVAWAPNIGIERVEVQIDDEPWVDAELGESLGINAWSQWRALWTATEGEHQIRVRATDRSGYTQEEARSPVAPDGATGWHTVRINIRA